MKKADLATQLRQRQHELGQVSPELIERLDDDQIIDSYITCSGCGNLEVSPDKLDVAIFLAHDADGFFNICQQLGTGQAH